MHTPKRSWMTLLKIFEINKQSLWKQLGKPGGKIKNQLSGSVFIFYFSVLPTEKGKVLNISSFHKFHSEKNPIFRFAVFFTVFFTFYKKFFTRLFKKIAFSKTFDLSTFLSTAFLHLKFPTNSHFIGTRATFEHLNAHYYDYYHFIFIIYFIYNDHYYNHQPHLVAFFSVYSRKEVFS